MSDKNLVQQVVERVTGRAQDLANQIAQSVGTPVDASKLNRDEIARLWNLPNPQADPMQVQQLIQQGQHSQALDMMYPWRNRLLGKGAPEQRVQRAATFARMASGQQEDGSGASS